MLGTQLEQCIGRFHSARNADRNVHFNDALDMVGDWETAQPANGKNVRYYRRRYWAASTVKHQKFFAVEFFAYAMRLEASP